MIRRINTVIISRTDSIGDVVLTLPVAHLLKQKFPGCKIIFLGKGYTKPVIECCENIDEIICWDEIDKYDKKRKLNFLKSLSADCIIHVFPNKDIASFAKLVGIPIRIGTSHRLFHWFTCNRLPNFTRKRSDLHESQLNLKLLSPLEINDQYSLQEIGNFFGFRKIRPLGADIAGLIDRNKYNLVLHPKSRGSAQEWHLQNFISLVSILPKDRFKIFITGTKEEGEFLKGAFSENDNVIDLTGKFSLIQLISFINYCDAVVAASTGPLHLAAVLGKKAIGIYAAVRPIHPGRWGPVGRNTKILQAKTSCNKCRKGKPCDCLSSVKPEDVAEILIKDLK